jgi:hypothetical protein
MIFRWHLFATASIGFAISVALIFSPYSTAGFALLGPLFMVPYCLGIVAFSKPSKWMPQELLPAATAFFLLGACLGLAWPLIVLFT